MKKIWILLALVLAVLFFGFREGLETGPVKAPSTNPTELPYPKEEMLALYDRIPQAIRNAYVQEANDMTSTGMEPPTAEALRDDAAEKLAFVNMGIYNEVYKNATAPLTASSIQTFANSMPGAQAQRAMLTEGAKLYFVGKPPPTSQTSTATPGAARTPGTRVPPRRANTQNDNIWGPKTTGLGTPRNFGDGDGSGAGRYPTLLGPPRTSSPYMTGVGVVGASQAGVTLPSSASLGSDPMAAFLPFSRQPGDQELVTDPYRVAQSYSPASYSSKNEPVPFLTDFSAFQ